MKNMIREDVKNFYVMPTDKTRATRPPLHHKDLKRRQTRKAELTHVIHTSGEGTNTEFLVTMNVELRRSQCTKNKKGPNRDLCGAPHEIEMQRKKNNNQI